MQIITLYSSCFCLFLLTACGGGGSKYEYEIYSEIGRVSVEKFDSSIQDDNRYTENNTVYREGNKYYFNYVHITDEGQQFQFNLQEGYENWVFSEKKNKCDTTVAGFNIKVIAGMSRVKEVIPDYEQTVIRYMYNGPTGKFLQAVETGLIENEKNIWMHPPREGYFKILQLNPFPFIQAPYQIGNKWKWDFDIGSQWGDERWATWQGNVHFDYEYEISDFSTLKTPLGDLDCYIVDAEGRGDLGETTLTSWFNFEYGFVKLEYTNIDSSKTIIELKHFFGETGEKPE